MQRNATERKAALDPRTAYQSVCDAALNGGGVPERLAWRRAFLAEIDRTLFMLNTVRLSFSFYSIRIAGLSAERTHKIIYEALHEIGFVGPVPGGAVGLFYIGPRAVSKTERQRFARQLIKDIRRFLPPDWRGNRVSLVIKSHHNSTDRISNVSDLLDHLFRLPAHVVSIPPNHTSPRNRQDAGSRFSRTGSEKTARLNAVA